MRLRLSIYWLACLVALTTWACGAAAGRPRSAPASPLHSPVAVRPGVPIVAPFADSFVVIAGGIESGWRRHSLERTPTGYRFVEAYYFGRSIGPTTHRTTEVILSPDLVVDSVRSRGRRLGQDVDFAVSYSGRAVRGWSTVTESGNSRRVAIDTTLPDSAFDVSALMAVLPALDWRVGVKVTLIQFDPEDATTQTDILSVVAEEQVTVPAGTFDVFRAEWTRPGNLRLLWYTRSLPHRLVRVASATRPWSTDLVNPSD